MKKFLAALVIAGAAILGTAGVASAHTGNVSITQDCDTLHVAVNLDHNVSADRSVTVTSTIPGIVPNITNQHFNSSYGNIYTADINSQYGSKAGTVTLTIDAGQQQEFTTSATVDTVDHRCTPLTCAFEHDFCGEVTLTPTCSGWTLGWENFYSAGGDNSPVQRDLTTSNGTVSRVTHVETHDGNDAVAAPVEGDKTVTVTASWTDSGGAPRTETDTENLSCPVTPPTTTPPTTTPPTTVPTEISTAVQATQPTLPGTELAYTGDMTATYAGLGAAAVLAGMLLLGLFRKGIFRNSTVLFGKIADA